MTSVDKVLENHSKRQKYLGIRVLVIFLLVVFGLDSLYKTENISNITFFNTMLLLFLPLFVEYLYGMDTYSGFTNTFRWIGLCVCALFVLVSFFGYMGKDVLINDNKSYVIELLVFHLPILSFLKFLSYYIIANTFFDYLFTFNQREKIYYNMIKDLEDFLEDNYKELKAKGSLEFRKNQFKKEILSDLKNNI
ncbi:hypothetical protein [Ectobacillus polymachus]|uniref:hypothetical protein n=1 Tax=Ectobacillus polymachus TaxID=1508806 RepID=UPI003A880012